MTENRYIYASIGIGYEILDSWFGYTGDGEPTEREIEEYDYLVIGLASNQDAAEGICRRLNDQQDEINHLFNFGLHVILDKKNKEIEELKKENKKLQGKYDKQLWLYNGLGCEYDCLKEENEQLKSRVEYLERKIDRERTSYQKQHEKWEEEIQKENEQLKKDCSNLIDDNTEYVAEMNHIKQVIKEAYNNERTQLGKSVLKQLLNNIEG